MHTDQLPPDKLPTRSDQLPPDLAILFLIKLQDTMEIKMKSATSLQIRGMIMLYEYSQYLAIQGASVCKVRSGKCYVSKQNLWLGPRFVAILQRLD